MKAKCNDTVRLEELSLHEIENYILKQPLIEHRPLFRNLHQGRRYEEITHYNSKVEGNILYTDSPLGGGTIGRSEGDIIEYKVDENIFRYKIIEIKR
jgi:hypothetical protein